MRVDSDPLSKDSRLGGVTDGAASCSFRSDFVLLSGKIVDRWEWRLTILVWQLLDEIELYGFVSAKPCAVQVVGHLVYLLEEHLLVERARSLARQELPVHDLEGVRDSVVLTLQGSIARQDGVVNTFD